MLRQQVTRTIRENSKSILKLLILNLIIPPIEIGIFGLIFLILNGTGIPEIVNIISNYITIPISFETSIWSILTLPTITLLTIIIWAFLRMARAIINANTRYNILTSQETEVVNLYFNISGDANNKENTEDISNLILQLSGALAAYTMAWIGLASALISIIMMSITAILTEPIITLIAITLGAISVIINKQNFKHIQSIGNIKVTTQREMLYEVNQSIRGFEMVRFDDLKHVVMQRMRRIIDKDKSWRVDKRTTSERVTMMSDSFGLISLLVIISLSSIFLPVAIETLLILILLFSRLRSYTAEFQSQWTIMKEFTSGTHKLIETKYRLIQNSTTRRKIINDIDSISIQDLSFGFDEELILDNISAEIHKGDQILLTGKSGNGKSTFLKLISGYYQPHAGSVNFKTELLGHHKSTDLNIASHVFYASNEMYLPNLTLKDFIDPDNRYSTVEIKHILHQSCLDELVENDGSLENTIGDNGSYLSLGQRQRLILSRIYSRSPAVVILDEVTSNLDEATERDVLTKLMNHLNPDTIIIISSHHHPPILDFNKTYQLSSGRLNVLCHSKNPSDRENSHAK